MGPRTTRTSAKARAPLATITNRNGSTTVPALLADSVCLSPDLLKLISEHFTEPCNSAQVCSQWTRAVLISATLRISWSFPFSCK